MASQTHDRLSYATQSWFIDDLLQVGPDIIQYPALRGRRGMNAVPLHHAGHQRDILEYERNERRTMRFRGVLKGRVEPARVVGAIVWREPNTGNQYRSARFPGKLNHAIHIAPDLTDRDCAQTVIAAKFDDDDAGLVYL